MPGWESVLLPRSGWCSLLLLAGWLAGVTSWQMVRLVTGLVGHLFLLLSGPGTMGVMVLPPLLLIGGSLVDGWIGWGGPPCLGGCQLDGVLAGTLLAPWAPPWYSTILTLAPTSTVRRGILAPPHSALELSMWSAPPAPPSIAQASETWRWRGLWNDLTMSILNGGILS